jgi:uncharacterized membrane protein required for colicin V production
MASFIGQMGGWDYLAFGGVAILVVRGFLRGCSGEISGMAGLLSAVAVGWFGFGPVERAVLAAGLFGANPYAARLVAFLLILVAGLAVWLLLGHLLKEVLQTAIRQPFDALLGGIFGGGKAFVAIAALCALGLLNPDEASRDKLQGGSVTVNRLAPLLQKITTPRSPAAGTAVAPQKAGD